MISLFLRLLALFSIWYCTSMPSSRSHTHWRECTRVHTRDAFRHRYSANGIRGKTKCKQWYHASFDYRLWYCRLILVVTIFVCWNEGNQRLESASTFWRISKNLIVRYKKSYPVIDVLVKKAEWGYLFLPPLLAAIWRWWIMYTFSSFLFLLL